MYKFTGFTEKANRALNRAFEIAEDMGHTYIGSEHLLTALLFEESGGIQSSFSSRGGTAGGVQNSVKKIIGTGMRASVMLHLPALVRKGAMRRLSSTVAKLGLTLRGCYSEGVEAAGDIFLLSNQVTLGISEEAALQNLGSIAMQIIAEEKQARKLVVSDGEFIDKIYRAKGILQSAYKLTSKELVGLTSLVLMGAEEKIIDVPMEELASMNILLMPATLRKAEGTDLSRDERDILRAKRIREVLG